MFKLIFLVFLLVVSGEVYRYLLLRGRVGKRAKTIYLCHGDRLYIDDHGSKEAYLCRPNGFSVAIPESDLRNKPKFVSEYEYELVRLDGPAEPWPRRQASSDPIFLPLPIFFSS